MTLTETLLVLNLGVMLFGFGSIVMRPRPKTDRHDDRLDTALATMARLEQSVQSTAKVIDGIHALQEKDQKIRHDLRDYVQSLEVRLVRLEEKMRSTVPK